MNTEPEQNRHIGKRGIRTCEIGNHKARRHETIDRVGLSAVLGVFTLLGLACPSITYAERTPSIPSDAKSAVRTTNQAASPAFTTIIEREEIERYHYQDALEALAFAPGVMVVEGTAGVEEATVYIDGDARVAIFIDGRRVNLAKGTTRPVAGMERGDFSWDFAPPVASLERIEVLHGAGYGTFQNNDAPAGVINFVTRKGEDRETTVSIGAGNQDGWMWGVTTEGESTGWHWRAVGGRSSMDDITAKTASSSYIGRGNTTLPDTYRAHREMYYRIDRDLTDTSSMTLTYGHMSNEKNRLEVGATRRHNKRLNDFTLSYNYKEGSLAPAYVRIYHHYRLGTQFIPTGYDDYEDEPSWTEWEHTTDGIDWHDSWVISKDHTVTVDASYEKTKVDYDYNDITASGYENGNYDTSNGRYQFNVTSRRAFGKFTLQSSMAFIHDDRFGGKLLTTGGGTYTADSKTTLYGNLERIYRAPSLDAMKSRRLTATRSVVGNPHLRPEEGWKLTGGLRHVFDERTSLDTQVFFSSITNPIMWNEYGSIGVGTNIRPVHGDGERTQGFTLSLTHRFSPRYSTDVSYNYTHRDLELGEAGTGLLHILDENDMARQAAKVALIYRDTKWSNRLMLLGLWGRDKTHYTGNVLRLDASLGYQMSKDVEVFIKAKNLLNASYDLRPTDAYNGWTASRGRTYLFGMKYIF